MRIVLFTAAMLLPTVVPTVGQPHADKRFDSGGVTIRYVDVGAGDEVLLIHGFGGRLEQGQALMPRFVENGFRVVAYDARGHGASGKPSAPEAYGEEDVHDVFRLLDHLGIRRAHLVGYSRGAWIAARAALKGPERVRSMVLGGWGPGNPVDTMKHSECEATGALIERGESPLPLLRALTPVDREVALPSAPRTAETAADARIALASAFRSGCGTPPVTAEALAATRIPILAVVGADDGMAAAVHRMSRQVPTLQVIVIPGTTHFTAPRAPEFTQVIAAFLGRRRSGSQ